MMYPFNYPFSRFLGGLGVPLSIKVCVDYDAEANVYYASSPNVKGLHVEADSLDAIRSEILNTLPLLLEINNDLTLEEITHRAPSLNICTPLHA